MNRKDVIIIAVLLNTAILAVLFITAINSSDDQVSSPDIMQTITLAEQTTQPATVINMPAGNPAADKFDLLLSELDNDDELILQDDEWGLLTEATPENVEAEEVLVNPNHVEIAVKKGDSLDKIARANNTTVQSIKDINHLKTDRLKIGQKLQVDVGSAKKVAIADTKPSPASPPLVSTGGTPVFYTLKSGDSPWKVAKQFHVNMDDLLRLNDLDEEKARNLKVGDKIRVR